MDSEYRLKSQNLWEGEHEDLLYKRNRLKSILFVFIPYIESFVNELKDRFIDHEITLKYIRSLSSTCDI